MEPEAQGFDFNFTLHHFLLKKAILHYSNLSMAVSVNTDDIKILLDVDYGFQMRYI